MWADFSWTLFHDHELTDDTSLVSAYRGETSDVTVLFHAVIRELRPPTDEERRAIIECIEVRHRNYLWNIMSRGIQMTSTLPAGTARESTLVRAITTRPFPAFDEGPLPDIVTTLLLAMCDPNNQGAPPRSTLEVAIQREEAHVVELLLQYHANPHLREPGQELPIIVAASRGALNCVKILLAYRADPGATEYLPSAEYPGRRSSKVWRKTAMEVAAPFPEISDCGQR